MTEHNDNKLPNSTIGIFSSLKEEDIPEHLLPPDSALRKKRETERFFEELHFAAFLEAIKLKYDFIFYLEKRLEAAQLEYEFEANRAKAISLPINDPVYKDNYDIPISQEQIALLRNLIAKYQALLKETIIKIEKLNQLIQVTREEIKQLQNQAIENKKEFLQIWAQNIDQMVERIPNQAIILPVSLPETYRHLPGASHYDGKIGIEKSGCKQILINAKNELLPINCDMKSIKEALRNQTEKEFIERLDEAWSFIPTIDRRNVIKEKIRSDEIQSLITNSGLSMIHSNKALMEKLDQINETEVKIDINNCKLQKFKTELVAHNSIKEALENSLADIIPKDLPKLSAAVANELINSSSNFYEKLESEIKHIETDAHNSLAEIEAISTNIDDMLGDLNDFMSSLEDPQAPETDNPTKYQEKLTDIKTKSENVIDLMTRLDPMAQLEIDHAAPTEQETPKIQKS